MREREPIGLRLRRFLVLIVILFVITAGIVVTQRLSDDALALLVGVICGVLALLPAVVLLVWLWRRQETRLQEERQRSRGTGSPPVVVVTPTMPPGYTNQRPVLWDEQSTWNGQRSERKFTIVGGED